jgi:hypothetical protein
MVVFVSFSEFANVSIQAGIIIILRIFVCEHNIQPLKYSEFIHFWGIRIQVWKLKV